MSSQNKIIIKKSKRKLIIEENEFRFPDELWNVIKKFAGYSNNYPTKLLYYSMMVGRPKNYCRTKMKSKNIKTFEDYIDRLWEICENLEEDVEFAFIPKQKPKTLQQMRIEWDSKYGVGDFDNDCY